MSELAGRLNYVKVLAGSVAMVGAGSPTGAKISGVDNSTFNRLCDLVEITEFGDTHKNRLATLKDSTVSLSGNYIPNDAAQLVLEPGDTVMIAVHPGGANVEGRQVKCLVESFEQTAAVDGKQTFSASLSGIAAPVSSPAHT